MDPSAVAVMCFEVLRDSSVKLLRQQIPALDALRGVAILMVLLHNFSVVGEGSIVGHVFDAGWVGVQLFFVLSGFLITGILLDTVKASNYFKSFFARRALRIFPLYYVVLFVGYIVVPAILVVPADHGQHQIWLWTYLANWQEAFGHGERAFPHLWSLAVEEQFYLVWPVLVYLLRGRGIVTLSVLMIVAAPVLRLVCRQRFGAESAYMFTICRMDALAMGAVLAAAFRSQRVSAWLVTKSPNIQVVRVGVMLLLGLVFVVSHGLPRTGAATQLAGYTLLSLIFTIWIAGEVGAFARTADDETLGKSPSVVAAPLRLLGKYSYAMYLFHAPLHLFVGTRVLAAVGYQATGSGAPLGVALLYALAMLAAALAAAWLSFLLIEQPALRLKARFAALSPVDAAG
jgi:peptidoglycan/LPS O-acetylase OafA/YrhL